MTHTEAEGPSAASGDIFHIENFRKLVQIMAEHDLNEVELRRGEQRVRLRRGLAGLVAPEASRPVALPTPVSASAPTTADPPDSDRASTSDEGTQLVLSQMVGTFYQAPNPESPPYVKIGDRVGPETILCVIEAMKVFTEIPAEISGRVVEVLVANGDPVGFGQPLFKIDTRG